MTMAHLLAMFLLGLLVVTATRGRLGHRRSVGSPDEGLEVEGMATRGTAHES